MGKTRNASILLACLLVGQCLLAVCWQAAANLAACCFGCCHGSPGQHAKLGDTAMPPWRYTGCKNRTKPYQVSQQVQLA